MTSSGETGPGPQRDRDPDYVDGKEWGRRLRDFRELRGLTQTELGRLLAEELGRPVAQDAVSEWEQGRRRPRENRRIALARCLRVPIAALFPYPDDVN